MTRPRVLVTGFGPFPGVNENPSGWLAETLAARMPAPDWEPHGHVLPTEWQKVTAFTRYLHDHLQPHAMIHFGVSPGTAGLRIENSAHNQTSQRVDACGALPGTHAISPQGPPRLDTGLPVASLSAHLRSRGHVARTSRSYGTYLCNFLYYRSLEWACAQGCHALFVHVPLLIAQGGPMTGDALLAAAQDTVGFVLDHATQGVPTASRPSPTHPVDLPK
jgi:pyroglutamyl-peptidase